MSVTIADIKWYKSQNYNNTEANGGKISGTLLTGSIHQEWLPKLTATEREAGNKTYRKTYLKNENVENLPAYSGLLSIDFPTPAGTYMLLHGSTDTDTEAEAKNYTDGWHGVGTLNESAAASAVSLNLLMDATTGFAISDTVRIGNTAVSEHRTIDQEPSWAGNILTIHFDEGLTYDYPSPSDTFVGSCLPLGDLAPAVISWVENSVSGSYDEVTYPPELLNNGTISDDYLLTFQGTSPGETFSVAGAASGSIGGGDINTDFVSDQFTLRANGFVGAWAEGDSIAFSLSHSARGFWAKRVCPQGIPSYSGDTVGLIFDFESA